MNWVLFDDHLRGHFLPLTYTKPMGAMRMGMFTPAERIAHLFPNDKVSFQTESYLHPLFTKGIDGEALRINARWIATRSQLERAATLQIDEAMVCQGVLLAAHVSLANHNNPSHIYRKVEEVTDALVIQQLPDIFSKNAVAMKSDFELATHGSTSAPIPSHVQVIGDPSAVYVHPSAKVFAQTINSTEGPVFLDAHSEVMEGSMIRGGFYLGQHAQLKMGTKIYGATTIGPHCKVGGEISNCVVQGYSNKGHDGFIGNSILGEWCNLGADTNTSNLKNNYGRVKTWSYVSEKYEDTGLTFCGLTMGDHSKCGINTMFNTGTVVGVGANIYGGNFPPKHIPSFTWGSSESREEYRLDKMMETAAAVYSRRSMELTSDHRNVLAKVFEMTAKHRLDTTQSQE